MKKKVKDLVQIIRDNPGCKAVIDNDNWRLMNDVAPPEGFDNWDYSKQLEWENSQELADSDDEFVSMDSDGTYGRGNCYGGDLLIALGQICNVKIESV